MSNRKINKHLILGIVVGALVVHTMSSFTTERKLNDLQISLEESINSESAKAVELAEMIGRGDATADIVKVIPDCSESERITFDTNLSQLDSAPTESDLKTIDLLFSRCAPVSSLRRTLMIMNLETSVTSLNSLIVQRKAIGNYEVSDAVNEALKEVVRREKERATYSLELVYIQREIIDLLMAGESPDSEALTALKKSGLDLRTSINLISEETKPYREILKTS